MSVKIRWTPLLIWLAVACIAALSCSLYRPAAHIGAEYFPLGNDSFYHAVRIRTAVADPAAFYEFDPKIHAPEGSLLVWPWGYDYFIAKIIRGVMVLGLGSDPTMIMLWVPVVAVFIGVGLLMAVARLLELGDWATALAGLCLALNASSQLLYGFGQIDHHYAEHIAILASLAAGLAWFKSQHVTAAAALGATFGIALAIHNALFILQVPFLATASLLWLQDRRPQWRPVIAFVVALLATALAMLLPSQPFQEGRFEFYTLSWFHLYIVCSSALVVILLAALQPTRRNIAVLAVIATALLVPLFKQMAYARSFIDGSLGMLEQVLEMRSPLKLLAEGEITQVIGFYSLLIALAPATFVLCALRLWRERQSPRLLFWVWCVFGLALLATQMRMHYFGVFALFLPWLIVAQEYARRHPELHKRIFLVTSLLLVFAYAPVMRHALVAPIARAADEGFEPLYPMFAPLQRACAEDPGVVLADNNAGHYIRYFSDCSVIANNFLLTQQQFEKVDEVNRLFELPAEELTKQAPFVKYVLVRAGKIVPKENDRFSYEFFGARPAGSSAALLLASARSLPPQFELIYEVSMQMRQQPSQRLQEVPYAKLYKVRSTPTSANDVGH